MTLDSQLRARRDLYALSRDLKAGRTSITEAHDQTRLILNRCPDPSVEARAVELGLIRRTLTWADVKAEVLAEGQPEVKSDRPLSVKKRKALDKLHASRRGKTVHPAPPDDVMRAIALMKVVANISCSQIGRQAGAAGKTVRKWMSGKSHPDPAVYAGIVKWAQGLREKEAALIAAEEARQIRMVQAAAPKWRPGQPYWDPGVPDGTD